MYVYIRIRESPPYSPNRNRVSFAARPSPRTSEGLRFRLSSVVFAPGGYILLNIIDIIFI